MSGTSWEHKETLTSGICTFEASTTCRFKPGGENKRKYKIDHDDWM
jgi:hypothetical protein